MKRICLYLFVALLTFGLGVLTWQIKWCTSMVSQSPTIPAPILKSPCPSNTFTVMHQPDATMQLVLVEANCTGFTWNARLTLQNLGPKAVRGYQVRNITDYVDEKEEESGQGDTAVGSVLLNPGEIKTLNFETAYQKGLSSSKPLGPIQSSIFSIEKVEYSDGASWYRKQ